MSWTLAEHSMYCWRRRSSFPSRVPSAGYSTAQISAARTWRRTASRWLPALKARRSKSDDDGSAFHRRREIVLVVR